MALPPLELFSLREKAALLPGGLFVAVRGFFRSSTTPIPDQFSTPATGSVSLASRAFTTDTANDRAEAQLL